MVAGSEGHDQDGRPRVGILSVNWTGVPPRALGSVAKVVHETSQPLADRFAFTILGGPKRRDPDKEVDGIDYKVVGDLWDRRVSDRWATLLELTRRHRRHPLYREIYRPFYARRAAAIFEKAGCQIIVVHQCPQWLPILRRRLPKSKLLFWGHAATHVEEEGRLRDQLAHADGVIGCSDYVTHRMEEQVPSIQNRAFTVYNGFDPELFNPQPAVARSNWQLFYLGRVTPEKGVHVLVDAFRLLAPRYESLELVVAGPHWFSESSLIPGTDPIHMQEIQALPRDYSRELVRRAGEYASRLHVVGQISEEEMIRLYRSCAVFVQPALWEEGFGIPVVEAMACGAPVVVSRRGGMPELIDLNNTGKVVESGDSKALGEVLAELLCSPQLREAIGRNAAETARQKFSWTRSAESFAAVLDRYAR